MTWKLGNYRLIWGMTGLSMLSYSRQEKHRSRYPWSFWSPFSFLTNFRIYCIYLRNVGLCEHLWTSYRADGFSRSSVHGAGEHATDSRSLRPQHWQRSRSVSWITLTRGTFLLCNSGTKPPTYAIGAPYKGLESAVCMAVCLPGKALF